MLIFLVYLLLSFTAASISFTVTVSGLFESMREWIFKKSTFFGKLITCPWCFGHYVVALILIVCDKVPRFEMSTYSWINTVITFFAIIGIMGIWLKTLILAFEPIHKMHAQREINKLKEAKLKAEIESAGKAV